MAIPETPSFGYPSRMATQQKKRAVVLLSGGLDSATILAIARQRGFDCFTLGVDYGQRHHAELQAAQRVAAALGSQRHKLVEMDLRTIGGSALTDDEIDVPDTLQDGIPVTYVPARNTIFLGIALGYAETLNANHLFIGVNAVDYSGYPDCRPDFIAAFEQAGQPGNQSRCRRYAISHRNTANGPQ